MSVIPVSSCISLRAVSNPSSPNSKFPLGTPNDLTYDAITSTLFYANSHLEKIILHQQSIHQTLLLTHNGILTFSKAHDPIIPPFLCCYLSLDRLSLSMDRTDHNHEHLAIPLRSANNCNTTSVILHHNHHVQAYLSI